MNRKDWEITAVVASVLLVLVSAAIYLSYEPNPFTVPAVGPSSTSWATALSSRGGEVRLLVNDEPWISCHHDENPTVNDARELLMDTYPLLAKSSAKLRAVSLSRWNLFDARRVGPRFAELTEPLFNNDYWESPFDVVGWFGSGPSYNECFHVACTDEKRLPAMALQPGDSICFKKD